MSVEKGSVAERFKAPVLKTGVPRGTVSSNLTASAIHHALIAQMDRAQDS